jgi:hypothetical protein
MRHGTQICSLVEPFGCGPRCRLLLWRHWSWRVSMTLCQLWLARRCVKWQNAVVRMFGCLWISCDRNISKIEVMDVAIHLQCKTPVCFQKLEENHQHKCKITSNDQSMKVSYNNCTRCAARPSDASKHSHVMTELGVICAILGERMSRDHISRLVRQSHERATVGTALCYRTGGSDADARHWLRLLFCAKRPIRSVPGMKRPAPLMDHSRVPNAEMKNEWSIAFTPHTPHCAVLN